ncbi:glycosyltransferase 87 family protein [Phycicoccus duodecadis]|uniref:Alpha-1,2-mannosyltransferase n=1 Tax=Phycicoccus duodecadis TaxID=173053 RepID=A0A2N3YK01_9MICO|nr:glycosyltransferase 87 family protein [Phycicoccus duodecadis]PKW27174.1 alpha-1,2-mannosyltransferase [Phycicoccus duodecadis]
MTAAPTRAVRRPSLGWLLGAAAALAMLWISWSHVRRGIWVDLDVYRAGGAAVRSGESLYDVRIKDLPFTYPPFAALLFVPAAVVSEHVARWGMTIVTMSAMVAVLEVVRRRLGLSRLDAVPLALAAFALEPVYRTLLLGQVNALLLLLVVLDCLVVPRRYRGLLIGIAIGIKLTPAVFVLWLLLRRDWGSAVRAVLAFLGTAGLAFVLVPSASAFFWSGGFADLGRFGSAAVLGVDNQSLSAAISRLVGLGAPSTAVVLAAGLGSVAAGTWVAHRRLLAGDEVGSLLAVAVGGLLASPISWSHHWIWVVVGLMWLASVGRTVALAVMATFFWLAPFWLFHRFPATDAPYGLPARVLATAYVANGVVLLQLLARPRTPTGPEGRAPASSDG